MASTHELLLFLTTIAWIAYRPVAGAWAEKGRQRYASTEGETTVWGGAHAFVSDQPGGSASAPALGPSDRSGVDLSLGLPAQRVGGAN